MTVLDMPDDTEVAVLEMGMNHFGEMAYLTSIARPDIAIITNIGTMHIEHLGSREGILQAKLEIFRRRAEKRRRRLQRRRAASVECPLGRRA